jgi:hypothetical protein
METKFKIIETEEYFLAVSDEEVKKGNWVIFLDRKLLYNVEYNSQLFDYNNDTNCKKIIAYQPKNNAPKLDLPLLPEMSDEDDVEKLAEEYADFSNDYIPISFGGKFNETSKRDFIAGYKAATKVHSEDDMKKAYNKGFSEGVIKGTCSMVYKHESFEEYIQFLKQSKTTPKWFVAEMTVVSDEIDHIYSGNIRYGLKTITINNKTYLVGTYSN